MDIRLIDHAGLNVRNLEASAAWYERVFGLTIVHKFTSTWLIGSGGIRLGLFHRPDATPVQDMDNRIAMTHLAFLIDPQALPAIERRLTELGIPFDPPTDIGIALSLFIKDPDGHELELIAYHA